MVKKSEALMMQYIVDRDEGLAAIMSKDEFVEINLKLDLAHSG